MGDSVATTAAPQFVTMHQGIAFGKNRLDRYIDLD